MRCTSTKTEHCTLHGPRLFFLLRAPQYSINSVIVFRDIYGIRWRDEQKDLSIICFRKISPWRGGVGEGTPPESWSVSSWQADDNGFAVQHVCVQYIVALGARSTLSTDTTPPPWGVLLYRRVQLLHGREQATVLMLPECRSRRPFVVLAPLLVQS